MPENGWIMLGETVLIMVRIWICLVKVSSSFEHTSSSKCQGLEYGKVVNMRGLFRVLNMHEYALKNINMREYVLIMLNVLMYSWIYLNKQSFVFDRILNVSNAVKNIMSLCNLLSSYWGRNVFSTLSNILRWSVCNQNCFRADEVSWN